jgi:hypothetical protein
MKRDLLVCDGCKRHVFAGAASCPHCGAGADAMGSGLAVAAAMLAAGLSLAACKEDKPSTQNPVYGPAPILNTDRTSQGVTPADTPLAPVYGPPPNASVNRTNQGLADAGAADPATDAGAADAGAAPTKRPTGVK